MIDCLLIGFNDPNFNDYVSMIQSMGKDSGAYRDLALAFRQYEGNACRSMDFLNLFKSGNPDLTSENFSNVDFLWPVLTYLGTYLERRGFTFDYIRLYQPDREKLRRLLLEKRVRSVAITTTLYVAPHPICEIIGFIRDIDKNVPIIIGGPYVINQMRTSDRESFEQLIRYLAADYYVISSEGEQTLAGLLAAMKDGGAMESVPNLVFKKGETYVFTETKTESNPLSENIVNYGLFPKGDVGEFVTLRSAKSCPFSCAFCGFPQRAGAYTYMKVEEVEQELNQIREFGGVTTLSFIDDTFNVPKARFRDMLRMMIRNQYGFKWNSFYRSDHGDAETIDLMREAGCEGVFLGIESGSDSILTLMNKTARRKDYRAAIPKFRASGISTYASIIVGFPGETEQTVRETISLIEEAQPEYFRGQLWYCDPLTPIWQQREKYDIQGGAFNWSHKTMNAAEACSWIEYMFLTVEGSIWLPQIGFEQWSTFYLQRKGLSHSHLRSFLSTFNTIIKETLLDPAKQEIDPALLEGLRESCRFGAPEPCSTEHLKPWNAGAMKEGLAFWKLELEKLMSLPPHSDSGSTKATGQIFKTIIPARLLAAAGIRQNSGLSSADTLVAAIASALSSLYQRPTSLLASIHQDDGVREFAMKIDRMDVFGDSGAQEAARQIAQCSVHSHLGSYALREFAIVTGRTDFRLNPENFVEISDSQPRPYSAENKGWPYSAGPRMILSASLLEPEVTLFIESTEKDLPAVVYEGLAAAIMAALEQLAQSEPAQWMRWQAENMPVLRLGALSQ